MAVKQDIAICCAALATHLPAIGVALLWAAPLEVAAQTTAPISQATGALALMMGKTYRSGENSVRFGMADDRSEAGFIAVTYYYLGSEYYTWLINILPGQEPVVRWHLPGTRRVSGAIKIGSSGIRLSIPQGKQDWYFLLDPVGNLDRVCITNKPDGPRLENYERMVDPNNTAGVQAGAIAWLDRKHADEVRQQLGVLLTALPDELDRPRRSVIAVIPAPPPTNVTRVRPVRAAASATVTAQGVALTKNAPRLALIVGNSGYGGSLGSLANAVNDAHAISAALRATGFQVVEIDNADQKAMKRAIIAFGQRLAAAGRTATGLFYYAGHGVQSRGTNYLVPVGASIEAEADIDVEAVAADTVMRQMEEAGASTSIVILDACRNMPVQRSYRDGTRGLARMDAPNGSFVAYSTAPGSVASDGTAANSPFAAALVAEIAKPGQQIEITFKNVRRAVQAATGGKQTPWDSSSLVDSFTFTEQ